MNTFAMTNYMSSHLSSYPTWLIEYSTESLANFRANPIDFL